MRKLESVGSRPIFIARSLYRDLSHTGGDACRCDVCHEPADVYVGKVYPRRLLTADAPTVSVCFQCIQAHYDDLGTCADAEEEW